MHHKKNIRFTIVEFGNSTEIETYENEYRNLMVLVKDRIYPDEFGECGGQGRCATCAVRIEAGDALLSEEYSRNEESTLQKKRAIRCNERLSCQILINDLLKGAIVHIENTI